MEIPLHGLGHVHTYTFKYILKHWKAVFTFTEKVVLIFIALAVILTSAKWALAASQLKNTVPKYGGTFIEGVVGSSLDLVDLGRLTKSGLVKIDEKGQTQPDLATKWEASADKIDYTFTLVSSVNSNDVVDVLKKNPTYLPDAAPLATDIHTISFKLTEPNANFVLELAQPIFPYGPYKVDKKTDTELRLKRNPDYYGDKAYLDRFIVRLYPDQSALQNAANHNKITAAVGLESIPKNWQSKEISLSRRHMLFINSSKYLKKTKVRDQLLKGEKPDGIQSLDFLEVNGEKTDPEYEVLKANLIKAGVDVKVRKVSLKDALKNDLPKRNYDVLYILVNEGLSHDPYLFWNSSQRSGVGQNFSELANADIDNLTEQLRITDDPAKQTDLNNQINKLVEDERISVQYKNLTTTYDVSPKVKGFALNPSCLCETDRFALAPFWHFYEKRQK
ncbi:MAG: ABC transporter substrate-binding protein [Candidatus Berkelbacteria bacterium]|nr:ABC transporter substrate-binding protein [Candidatus Berkelbacteria bacterium]